MPGHRIAFLFCCTLLAACARDKAGTAGTAGEDGLPKPAAASGSVTGMPNPGIAEPRPAGRAAQAVDTVDLPAPPADGEIAPVDPAPWPMPSEGPPVMLPAPTMPEDPYAPPPPPVEDTASPTDPNPPRQ